MFPRLMDLGNHRRKVHGCPSNSSGRFTSSTASGRRHLFQCDHCKKKFKNKKNLKQHKRNRKWSINIRQNKANTMKEVCTRSETVLGPPHVQALEKDGKTSSPKIPHVPKISKVREEEVAFPRGGASILTPLEHKQIQIEASRDVLFKQQGAKSTGSRKRSSVSADLDESENCCRVCGQDFNNLYELEQHHQRTRRSSKSRFDPVIDTFP